MPSPIVLDTSPEHVAYALLGCFIIVFGLVSLFVKEKLFISEACKSRPFSSLSQDAHYLSSMDLDALFAHQQIDRTSIHV